MAETAATDPIASKDISPPVLGSAATAAGDAPAADASKSAAAAADDDGGEPDLSPNFAPVIELTEVETKTGEEDEVPIFKMRSKLFRFDRDSSEWKERGTGEIKFLQHKENKKIRLLMRREKTLKICLNHFVNVSTELSENIGSDRSWVFHAVDYADGERDEAMLAIRFANPGNAQLFKNTYESAKAFMKALSNGETLPELLIQAEDQNADGEKGEKVPDAVKSNSETTTATDSEKATA